MPSLLMILLGLGLLVLGAEWLVRGAAAIAARLGLSSLVIGLTVVAFGTSAPEIAVSVGSVLTGRGELAVANVVGSNIFNILAILGLASLVRPLLVERRLVRVDVPLMIGVSILLWGIASDQEIAIWEAGCLVGGVVVYTLVQILGARSGSNPAADPRGPASEEPAQEKHGVKRASGIFVTGLVVTLLGARLLVDGAVDVAAMLGVSDIVIGLTIVAAGTSLPELATSVVAAVRGQRDLAVGGELLGFDIPVMVVASIACLPVVFTGHRIGRLEGGVLLAAYSAYLAYIVLDATGHALFDGYTLAILFIGGPAVLIGLVCSVMRSVQSNRRGTLEG